MRKQRKQVIDFDTAGYIISSTDVLFSTQQLRTQSLKSVFPFIESIFPEIVKLFPKEQGLLFERVATRHSFLPGYYDFKFSKIKGQEKEFIRWTIFDFTEDYKVYANKLQRENEDQYSDFEGRLPG